MDEMRVERVLRAVESIPPGAALPYGQVGRAAGAHARYVARVLSLHGAAVPWWRVPNARGVLPPPLMRRALPHLQEEGTPLTPDGRIDLRRAAVDAGAYARTAGGVLAELGALEESDTLDEERS